MESKSRSVLDNRLRAPSNLLNRIKLFLPVQSGLQKYFRFGLTQIRCISLTVPSRQEGRIARRHERGAGCGGRESVRRARQSQGEMNLVSGQLACKMIGALADGKAVWFRHPLLVPSWRRRNQARPGLISLNPPATVTTRIRSPGRARYKLLKPLRGECRVGSGVTVVTTLVCFVLFRTRGCGCIGHPAFPAPSFFLGGSFCKTRAHRAARSRRRI